MLYLEDYLEMIENLPMEMTDRFTEMREMDLQVQNAMDSLDDKMKTFFQKCKSNPTLKQEWKDEQFGKLKKDYHKALEDADEKVQLANQIYEMVERYLRKLDQELAKFKMELEADNSGITEVLERRSLEMDTPLHGGSSHRGESRKRKYAGMSNHVEKRPTTERVLSSIASEAARETLTGMTRSSSTPTFASSAGASPALSYNLGHVGAGSNAAIAAAASRAIGATLELPHGRRTASLKASYDALKSSKDLLLSSSSTPAAEPPPPPPSTTKSGRNKKSSSRASQQAAQQAAQAAQQAAQQQAATAQTKAETPTAGLNDLNDLGVDADGSQTTTWAYDPNEPRYCICNDVSYGDMVGCDNDDCPIEWFHYNCVGLSQAPKGKWYCPQCTAAMKRRGRK